MPIPLIFSLPLGVSRYHMVWHIPHTTWTYINFWYPCEKIFDITLQFYVSMFENKPCTMVVTTVMATATCKTTKHPVEWMNEWNKKQQQKEWVKRKFFYPISLKSVDSTYNQINMNTDLSLFSFSRSLCVCTVRVHQ